MKLFFVYYFYLKETSSMKSKYKLITILGAFSLLLTACNFTTGDNSSNAPSKIKNPKKYTVMWKNEDGILLEVDDKVLEGTIPTYDGPTPAKKSDVQHDYVFDGWNQEVKAVDGDIEYFAKYKEEARKYTITWKNYDGTVLKTDQVPYGETPTYTGEEPTKEQTTQRTYTFDKWSPEISAVEDNKDYIASFKDEPRKYKVTWKNEDGSIIKVDDVPYGTVPTYEGDEPHKDSTPQLNYKFKSWTPLLNPVTGDAEYTATYTSEDRKYTITWKNYDGSVLEVDDDAKYGDLPKYNGATPKRNKGQGFEYTFSGWTPSVLFVTKDTEYVATYSTKPTFCFTLWDYEMEEGASASELQGAPWINSNIKWQLNKIKKPSLKDDFYASVNYETIKNGDTTPFDECEYLVSDAFEKIDNGTANTTNSGVLYASYSKMVNGDYTSVKNQIDNLDVTSYVSSKEIFKGTSPFAYLLPLDNGYELAYNDGYHTGAYNYSSLWFYGNAGYSQYLSFGKSIVNDLSSVLNLGFSANDVNTIASIEGTTATAIGNADTTLTTYTVSKIPWPQMKSALLDLGLQAGDTIKMQNCYKNCFNYLYNSYLKNNAAGLADVVKARIGFNNRFILGAQKYRQLNNHIVQTGFFDNESGITYGSDEQLAKNLAKLCFSILNEQAYIELEGDELIKDDISNLIDDILEGYMELADSSWLGTQTKNRMKSKLSHMGYASCYSDGFKSFPKLEFVDLTNTSIHDIYDAYNNAHLQTIKNKTADLTGYWDDMHSYTVNAYYSPGENIFVILNAIVKGLMGETIEEKYGMIGAVIGHEITHAFDSTGSQFDENGNYNNWWSNADKSTFNKKVNNMVSFYNKIHLKKDLTVDGSNVNGEATADMGGIRVMLKLAEKIEDFDYQEFFKAYARVWCRDPISMNEVASRAEDTHPFNYLRTNVTVAQFDEFIEAFDIQPGDGMYIPAEERIAIW